MAEQFIASKQLPYVLQSTKLKNFFDSTVDQWFKNEDSKFEKGFVILSMMILVCCSEMMHIFILVSPIFSFWPGAWFRACGSFYEYFLVIHSLVFSCVCLHHFGKSVLFGLIMELCTVPGLWFWSFACKSRCY